MSKRAFLVAIGSYNNPSLNLSGPPNDIDKILPLLSRNEDRSLNFECVVWRDETPNNLPIDRDSLRQGILDLFNHDGEVLFYYSGHGYIDRLGGYLVTADCNSGGIGVTMDEIVRAANSSKAKAVTIILDCCHSGAIGNNLNTNGDGQSSYSLLCENHVFLAASKQDQAAMEANGQGFFTNALADALDGGAVDHEGWITAPSVYTYISRRFGAWHQRPVFKANITDTILLRKGAPLIDKEKLLRLIQIFPVQDHKYSLDPEFEPEDEFGNMHEPVNREKVELAHLFKDYRDAGCFVQALRINNSTGLLENLAQ